MSAPTIGVVDYGMGNRRSVEKALEHVGARAVVSHDPERVVGTDGLIVPGVGAFPQAMGNLSDLGLDTLIVARAKAGTPILGICLGMQLLFEASTELGGSEGLGLLAGRVERLEAPGAKLPHIGWNEVSWRRESSLVSDLPQPCAFYHVHSFVAHAADDDVLGESRYGETFASVVERGCVFGVQFHPEKSSMLGLALLANFSAICERVTA